MVVVAVAWVAQAWVAWGRPFSASCSRWTNLSKRSERRQGLVIIPFICVEPSVIEFDLTVEGGHVKSSQGIRNLLGI